MPRPLKSTITRMISLLGVFSLVLANGLILNASPATVSAAAVAAPAPEALAASPGNCVVRLNWRTPAGARDASASAGVSAPDAAGASGVSAGASAGAGEAYAGAEARVIWYRLYRWAPGSAGGRELIATVPSDTLTWLDYRVENGKTYRYTVTAVYDQKVESAESPAATATPGGTGVEVVLTVGQALAMVSGAEVTLDSPPVIIDGRTMVPLRFVGTALGANVAYEGRERRVTVTLEGRVVVLWLGRTDAYVNSLPVPIDTPPTLVQGRTMVPIRFIAEAFGAQVGYDAALGRVTVATPDTDASPDAAVTVVQDVPVAGSLSGPNDVDFYRFDVVPGFTYVFRTQNLSADCDTILAVVDPTSGVVAINDDWGLATRASEIEYTAPRGQSYVLLRVQAAPGGAGLALGYDISVSLAEEPAGETQPLRVSGSRRGELHAATDTDTYVVEEAEVGVTYNITVTGLETDSGTTSPTAGTASAATGATSPVTGTTSPIIGLWAPAAPAGQPGGQPSDATGGAPGGATGGTPGTPATSFPAPAADIFVPSGPPTAADADAEGVSDGVARVVWRCQAAGPCYIVVGSQWGEFGPYEIEMSLADEDGENEGSSRETAEPVVPDVSRVTKFFATAADEHWFSFRAAAGTTYHVGTVKLGPGVDTVVSVYGPDGAKLGSNDDFVLGWSLLDWRAPAGGTYYVKVAPYAAGAGGGGGDGGAATGAGAAADPGVAAAAASTLGRYSFCVTTTSSELDDAPRFAPTVAAGYALERSLTEGDDDYFRIDAVKGYHYSISLAPRGDSKPLMELWNGDFATLLATGATQISWIATLDGPVYVRVYPASRGEDGPYATGFYSLSLWVETPPEPAEAGEPAE